MNSTVLKRIDDLARRHLLLSSFLCLNILSVFPHFFFNYTSFFRTLSPYPRGLMEHLTLSVTSLVPFFEIVPFFFISLLLYFFMKRKGSSSAPLNFFQSFIFSFVPSVLIILLFLIFMAKETLAVYPDAQLIYTLALFNGCLYSVGFSLFLGWYAKLSKIRFIVTSTIVTLIVGMFYLTIFILNQIRL